MFYMSQILQEQSKYITVQEFLPRWTDLVEKKENPSIIDQENAGLCIWKGQSCLVGEAWNFDRYSDDIGGRCKECSQFFTMKEHRVGILYCDAIRNLKDFYKFKQGLYDHFMESHSYILLIK